MLDDEFAALSDEELSSLESEFLVRLPESYRNFLQNYPRRLTEVSAEDEAIAELQLVNSYEQLLELNTSIRNPDYWFFGEHPWPNHFFVIGGDGYGNHYFLDTSGEYPGVRFQDSNNWAVGHAASSLESFVERLEEGLAMEDEEN